VIFSHHTENAAVFLLLPGLYLRGVSLTSLPSPSFDRRGTASSRFNVKEGLGVSFFSYGGGPKGDMGGKKTSIPPKRKGGRARRTLLEERGGGIRGSASWRDRALEKSVRGEEGPLYLR